MPPPSLLDEWERLRSLDRNQTRIPRGRGGSRQRVECGDLSPLYDRRSEKRRQVGALHPLPRCFGVPFIRFGLGELGWVCKTSRSTSFGRAKLTRKPLMRETFSALRLVLRTQPRSNSTGNRFEAFQDSPLELPIRTQNEVPPRLTLTGRATNFVTKGFGLLTVRAW